MNRQIHKKTAHPRTPTPHSKSLKTPRSKTSRQSPHPNVVNQGIQTKSPSSSSQAIPKCPHCGGWVIVERVMNFYSDQTLQKCLNCGRILVNSFLPAGVAQPSHMPQPNSESSPIKLDCNFSLRFPNTLKDSR